MADAVLVANPSDPSGPKLLAYMISVTNSDGSVQTGLAFANIIVAIPSTSTDGSTDLSTPGNVLVGALQ